MLIYQITRINYKIISLQMFLFFIFMILQTKINSSTLKLVINKIGRQQILYKNFTKPSEIQVNNQIQINEDYFVNLEVEESNITIRWENIITTCEKMFYDLKNITSIEFIDFNTSSVNNMESMFSGCSNLISINFGNFDVSSVSDMSFMFSNCKSLKSLDLSSFNTSKVTSMARMFGECSNLKSINLENFNTSKVTEMNYMFYLCSNLISLNLKNFNTSLVTTMDSMFSGCKSLSYLNLENFNTSLVSDMKYMFNECNNLVSLNLDSFDTSSVISMLKQFYNCYKLSSLGINNFSTSLAKNMSYMFFNCSSLTSLNLLKFNISANLVINGTFQNLNKNITVCYKSEKISSLINELKEFKNNCSELCCRDNYSYSFCYKEFDCPNIKIIEEITTNNLMHDNYNYSDINDNNNNYKNFTDKNIENIDKIKKIGELDFINLLTNLTDDLIVYYFEEYLENIDYETLMNQIIGGEDIVFKKSGLEIHISNSKNQLKNKNKNETTILLGDCENELKNSYNISNNESLIIFKVDIMKDDMKIPKTEYNVFYPLNGSNLNLLNLSKCDKLKIEVLTPILINNEDIDKYNPNSDYYRDICYKSSNNKGIDIVLDDRKNEYLDNNMNACEETCDFVDYDSIYKKVKCSCDVKKNMAKPSQVIIDKIELMKKFINIKNLVNLKIMKCYKIFLSKSGIIKNYAFYIISVISFAHFVFIFLYCFIDKKKLEIIINSIIKISNSKSKFADKYSNDDAKDINKETHNIINKKNKKKSIKIKKGLKKHSNKKLIINSLQSKNNLLVNNYSNNVKKKKKNSYHEVNNNISIQTHVKDKNTNISLKNMTINELNSLPYNEALIIDSRTYCQYTISLIKVNHIFIFSFFVNNDYNSKVIKIDLFFFLFAVSFGINALFFTDSTMHQIYADNGVFNFIYQIPKIIYSTLISAFINLLVTTLALTEKSVIDMKSKSKKQIINKEEKEKINIIIKLKIILFYILSSLLYIFFWYYLGCFCAVYENTQRHLVKDTFMSFLLSMIYPLFINMIPGIFRISALKNKNNKNLYKLSQLFQLI